MNTPVYVLDANVFIEAAKRYYAFDLETKFWDCLVESAINGRLQSIDRVRKELERVNDELAQWVKGPFRDGFALTDEDAVIDAYRRVIVWVQTQDQFFDEAKVAFAGGADGWLVAYAIAKGCVLVTQEAGSREAKRRVPLPNVCEALDVRCVNTFMMLRELRLKLS